MNKHTLQMLNRLHDLGITPTDALALRRISMTLQRWHELECGDSNNYGSWCITRGTKSAPGKVGEFVHDDDGLPYLEHQHYGRDIRGAGPQDYTTYTLLPDRERGAKRRLAKILTNYPHLTSYIQTDPRGCALHILRKSDLTCEASAEQVYNSRGIAVHR